MIGEFVAPGVSTDQLNQLCHDFMISNNAVPATLGYRGFPKSCCISINHVVCHGIPGNKKLKEGDILNIDVTCILDGWYGDTSRMYVAGEGHLRASRLIDVTHESLMRGISVVKPGNTFGDIGATIQKFVESNKMSVVRDFCGHGLGEVFHSAPNVLHYGTPGTGPKLEAGMFFTIEPMVNLGKAETKILSDNWTAVTKDKSLSAQFEHSIGVTEHGCEIFTLSPNKLFYLKQDLSSV
jgi:methionyl aminopeptidase